MSAATQSPLPLALYRHGRCDAYQLLELARVHRDRLPLRELLPAAGAVVAHRNGRPSSTGMILSADAAFLVASAAGSRARHALDVRITEVLDHLNEDAQEEKLDAALATASSAARRSAGAPAPPTFTELTLAQVDAGRATWLRDLALHRALRTEVRSMLIRAKGQAAEGNRAPLAWASNPTGMPALSEQAGDWSGFVQVQALHVVAAGAGVPARCGPLHPAVIVGVELAGRLELIDQLHVLEYALTSFRHRTASTTARPSLPHPSSARPAADLFSSPATTPAPSGRASGRPPR